MKLLAFALCLALACAQGYGYPYQAMPQQLYTGYMPQQLYNGYMPQQLYSGYNAFYGPRSFVPQEPKLPSCPANSRMDSTETVCCPATCGACGGEGCAERPGGADSCCTEAIAQQPTCARKGAAPCSLSGPVAAAPVPVAPRQNRDRASRYTIGPFGQRTRFGNGLVDTSLLTGVRTSA
jgi:hypothetical protein